MPEGTLDLSAGGTAAGDPIAGTFHGAFGNARLRADESADSGGTSTAVGLIINEVAAKGDPLDWFELTTTADVDRGLIVV